MPRGAPFPLFTCAISSFFAPKPHGNACYAGYGGPREQCRSVPRGGVEKKKGSVEDRESGVALCHGVALKKRREIGRGPREQYRSVPRDGVKKERIGRGPRERCRSVPQGGVKKKEREIGRGPREQYRSVPRGGVKKETTEKKKMIGRGPRERCIAIPRFGINNALQGRKERNSKGVWEGAESRSLCCFN